MNIQNNRNKRTNIFKAVALCLIVAVSFTLVSVSYTHLTLPTNREV